MATTPTAAATAPQRSAGQWLHPHRTVERAGATSTSLGSANARRSRHSAQRARWFRNSCRSLSVSDFSANAARRLASGCSGCRSSIAACRLALFSRFSRILGMPCIACPVYDIRNCRRSPCGRPFTTTAVAPSMRLPTWATTRVAPTIKERFASLFLAPGSRELGIGRSAAEPQFKIPNSRTCNENKPRQKCLRAAKKFANTRAGNRSH